MTRPSSEPTERRVQAVEWAVIAVMALASMVFVVAIARHGWFRTDVWDYITEREIGSVADLLRHHAGHFAIYGIVATRITYAIAGLDFSPLYPAVGAAVWATFGVVAWRWLRHRGTHPLVALGTAGVLLFMSTAGWLEGWFIDTPVAMIALLGSLTIVALVERPRPVHQVALFGTLLASLTGGGAGAAGVLGLGLAMLITGRVVRWWPSLTAGALTYGVWYLSNRGSSPQLRPTLSVGEWLIDVPATTADLWRLTLARLFLLPDPIGWVLLVALAVLLGWLIRSGRMDLPTTALLLAAALFTVLVVAVKVIPRGSPVGSSRYAHITGVFVLLALAPHLRLPTRRVLLGAVAAGMTVLVACNAVALHDDIVRFRRIGLRSQPYVEAAGFIVEQGEPIIDGYSMGLREGFLKPEGLHMLLDDGWDPPPISDQELGAELRGQMRMTEAGAGAFAGADPVGAAAVDEKGCAYVPGGGGTVAIDVTAAGVLQLLSQHSPAVTITWSDAFGTGIRSLQLEAGSAVHFRTAPPQGATTLTVTGNDRLRICGLVP